MAAKLTAAQGEALLKVVAYQRQAGQELVFVLETGGDENRIYPWNQFRETVTTIPREYVTLWRESGYITTGERPKSGSVTTFILRQEALDYEQ
jgi:hypothetical protein